ncbi:MAG: hypothetical protein RR088_01785 [Clostridia bacterium]
MAQSHKIDFFRGINEQLENGKAGSEGEALDCTNFKITKDKRLIKRTGIREVFKSQRTAPKDFCKGVLLYDKKETIFYLSNNTLLSFVKNQTGETIIRDFKYENNVTLSGIMFIYNQLLYLMTSDGFMTFDGVRVEKVLPYCPTLILNSTPYGIGTPFEDTNLLSKYRMAEYITDKNFTTFKLPERDILEIVYIEINGSIQPTSTYTVNLTQGSFTLLGTPNTGFKLKVKWAKDNTGDIKDISTFTNSMFFGGATSSSLFIWGGVKNPTMRRFSYPGKIDYFPTSNYSYIGSGQSPITNIISQYSRQIIFTENEIYYSTLDMTNPLNVSFPVFTLNSGIGCEYKDTVRIINNSPVFMSKAMLFELVSTNIQDERNVRPIGQRMINSLKAITSGNLTTFDDNENSEFYLSLPTICLVYNYEANAWYKSTGIKNAKVFFKLDDEFYFIDETGSIFLESKDLFEDYKRPDYFRRFTSTLALAPLYFNSQDTLKQSSNMVLKCSKESDLSFSLTTDNGYIIPLCDISKKSDMPFSLHKYKLLSSRFISINLKIESVGKLSPANITELYFNTLPVGK